MKKKYTVQSTKKGDGVVVGDGIAAFDGRMK